MVTSQQLYRSRAPLQLSIVNILIFCGILVVLFAYSCDGPCMRSFHAIEGTGEDSYCTTLEYTEAEIEVSFEAVSDFLCNFNFHY
jgi:hypothetical protein